MPVVSRVFLGRENAAESALFDEAAAERGPRARPAGATSRSILPGKFCRLNGAFTMARARFYCMTMRVNGPGQATPPSATRKSAPASGRFCVDQGARTESGGAAVAEPQPSEMLSALIEIQGNARREGERRRSIAAAQRTLSLLDRLRLALLEGALSDADLDALALSSTVRADVQSLDPDLQATLDDIVLRARVELAKRGR